MTLLQLGIGTLNDVVDAPADAGRKPGKPIPAGLVGGTAARRLVVGLFAAGVVVAASVALVLVPLALIVIAIGLAYDLRLKGTAWSWLPFAVGIPILPVFGWVGATGSLPASFRVVIPVAIAAGAALAIGNSLVDVERDRAAGRSSIAARLGLRGAATLATSLFAVVAVAALVTALGAGASTASLAALLFSGLVAVVASSSASRSAPAGRERAWRAEAVATGVLAIVWLGAVPLS
jgi:4-hydroxybenzoate polyprenyltransferase